MGTKNLAAYSGKLDNSGLTQPYVLAGAPTSGASGSFVGRAIPGSMLVDTVNAKLYMATSATTSTNVTWGVVGAQT